MTETLATPAAAPAPAASAPTPQPAAPSKTGHNLTDPGDASPIGRSDESDFEPRQVGPLPYGATEVVKPNT